MISRDVLIQWKCIPVPVANLAIGTTGKSSGHSKKCDGSPPSTSITNKNLYTRSKCSGLNSIKRLAQGDAIDLNHFAVSLTPEGQDAPYLSRRTGNSDDRHLSYPALHLGVPICSSSLLFRVFDSPFSAPDRRWCRPRHIAIAARG